MLRRSLLARLLKLPPPRHAVDVERDIPVPMPDGVRLLTDHFFPKAAGDFPTILIRTPYGRGKELVLWGGYALGELPAQRIAERGYHVVVQGARGCFDSEGTFDPHVNEAADGVATIEWLGRQPWFNNVLGVWGPSYLGYAVWATAVAAPTAVKAMLVVAARSENYSVTHPDGAFGLETRLRWSQGLHTLHKGHRRPLAETLAQRLSRGAEQDLQRAFDHLPLLEADRVATGEPIPFYRALLTHSLPDDPYWVARGHSQVVAGVGAEVHLVGGWHDYYLRGLLRDYATLKAAGHEPYLTIGPWHHAHPAMLIAGLREAFAWFDAHLKGEPDAVRDKPVRLFVTGADAWREWDEFPPPSRETRYYLHADAALSTDVPPAISPPDGYRYDPADPTPALGGALLAMKGAGPADNRPLEARSDVRCYTTLPLASDVEVAGPVRLELFARSSLANTDFFSRLCDVHPDGRSVNVCDGLFRVVPGRAETGVDECLRVEIDMWAAAHCFRAGHRLRLQVSSGAHPRWSRNLGTGEATATGTGMAVAQQTIYHDAVRPSGLVLPVLDRSVE